MGTHAVLGVKLPDGSISGCYVHYDGSTMRERIEDYLKKHSSTGLTVLIAQAQSTGGMRSFHCPRQPIIPGKPITKPVVWETEFLDDDERYAINETNFYEDHFGAHYWYLVNYDTGEIQKRHN